MNMNTNTNQATDGTTQACELTEDERTLLTHIHRAGEPVEASSFFAGMNTETGRRATERQVELFGAYVSLWERDLITSAIPAGGNHADKMVSTASGEAALHATGEGLES